MFSYVLICRISIKGNGTCALSRKMPKPEELQTHADYDVYVRSQRSLHCEPDRLYKMRRGGIGERGNETKSTVIFGSGLSDPTISSILSSSRYDSLISLSLLISNRKQSHH